MAIERLESMQANNRHNYDYVVLQATNNSIPFYESMGFVRVGAVTTANNNQNSNKENEVRDMSSVIASGPARRIKTNSRGTLRKICKELNVDVWDVTFLNKDLYPNISQKSVIQTDTELFIPDTSKLDGNSNATDAISLKSDPSVTKWYDAKDNETPREIAKTFNVCLKQLLMANKGRIQGLQGHSKLVEECVSQHCLCLFDIISTLFLTLSLFIILSQIVLESRFLIWMFIMMSMYPIVIGHSLMTNLKITNQVI